MQATSLRLVHASAVAIWLLNTEQRRLLAIAKAIFVEQILDYTNGKGVDRIIIAGGNVDTMAQAVSMLKPGGIIGNVNYLGSGEFVKVPRVEWGCGMSHKQIRCGLTPGGRLRSEKLLKLIQTGRIDPGKMITHRLRASIIWKKP